MTASPRTPHTAHVTPDPAPVSPCRGTDNASGDTMSENIEVVVLGGGSTLAYDHLVHAVGSGASAPGVPGGAES